MLGDPEFQWAKFWDQPCTLLEKLVVGIDKDEEMQANKLSITTAKLIDSIQSISHSLYGKEGSEYKSNIIEYLPFPDRLKTKEELENAIVPTKETIAVFLELAKQGRIPTDVLAHLQPLVETWTRQ